MDGLADCVPFHRLIVCTLYGPVVPVLCLTCLLVYWGYRYQL